MKLKIIDAENTEKGSIDMPEQFSEDIRPDIIWRAVMAIQNNARQQYGADPEAGKKAVARISRRRRDWKGSYGLGISRVPRKVLSHRGTRFNWVGAVAPGMVGGRRAHPPKATKVWEQKINKNENRKAIRSALAATLDKNIVEERGHNLPATYPFIIDSSFEQITKTKDLRKALLALGLEKELERAAKKNIRAGKGKMRGRRYKKAKGPLIVISKQCDLVKAATNIPGIDIIEVNKVNAELLAPGADIGRMALYTKSAIERIEKEKLFMNK